MKKYLVNHTIRINRNSDTMTSEISRRGVLLATTFAILLSGCAIPNQTLSNWNVPTVTGPVSGGQHNQIFGGYLGDISKVGYVEQEFFLGGDATSFKPIGEMSIDGKWAIEKSDTQPYKTRIIVRRPVDPKDFNGTVVVEWINVSLGTDTILADARSLYDGYAYVGVSAQVAGVKGPIDKSQGLVQWDPERYSDLHIPADAFSYNIFSQAGRALGKDGTRKGLDPLDGLDVKEIIAVGVSQSGGRLWTYANAVQPSSNVYDAIMPIASAGSAALLIDIPGPRTRASVKFSNIREDSKVPVFAMNTESEAKYYVRWRQADTESFRYWEVAGASHGPSSQVRTIYARNQRDGVTGAWDNWTEKSDVMWLPTLGAAIREVQDWIRDGEAPPKHSPIEFVTENGRPVMVRDTYGNAVGGVRLPELEVPTAHHNGQAGQRGLAGSSESLDAVILQNLYPTHEDYVLKVKQAAEEAVEAGIILPWRKLEYIEESKKAAIPK